MTRGTLRVYLGAAPGVGKTFAMLSEGRRRRERGTDVVVGYVETHGRIKTAEQLADLEVQPRRSVTYRGAAFEEMDLDGLVERRPEIALVDELAHTNVPGSRNEKRWQDVDELLDAGIDVISTVNIQHLESINDVVERITGVAQRETIPDDVVRSADQIELVDMTPEALRRRMAHGNIYAADKIDAALTNYFREGNLGALRELALLWVADQVDVALEEYRRRHGIAEPWETRERVVVALTGAPGTENLIRRGARMARRAHGDLLGVHVVSQQGLARPSDSLLAEHRRVLEQVGGEYHEVAAGDVATALVEVARAENATQLVLGSSRSSRWQELTRGSVINRVIRLSGPIDVHVISNEASDEAAVEPLPRVTSRYPVLGPRRRLIAWLLTLVGLPLLTAALTGVRDDLGLPTVIVLYLLLVVAVAAVGGFAPALTAATVGFLAVNWYFTPPLHELTVQRGTNVLALSAYLLTAIIVGSLVAVAARRTAEANRSRAEARTLSALASSIVDVDPLPVLMGHLRRSFGLAGVSLLRRTDDTWAVEASDGACATTPDAADDTHPVGDDLVLTLTGRDLAVEDRSVLNAFAANLAVALERRDLHSAAAHAAAEREADELRSAMLESVSQDLRAPLARIKASLSSLRQPDATWTAEETAEFLANVEAQTDRLGSLVDTLLDMSRIHAEAVAPLLRPIALQDVVPVAVASLGARAREVVVDLPEGIAPVYADPLLLGRVVANLVDNAITFGDGEEPVRVEAGVVSDRLLLRVIDRGRGIPTEDVERVFHPFQRPDHAVANRGAGVGLGLAVARGFARAMGGDVTIEDTPGGGTTVVVDLRVRP